MSKYWILLGPLLILAISTGTLATDSSHQEINGDNEYQTPVVEERSQQSRNPTDYPEYSDLDMPDSGNGNEQLPNTGGHVTSEEDARGESSQGATPITIFIVGRSGSGVSSTIRELIGPNTECQMPEGKETFKNFMEYTLSNISSSSSNNHSEYKIKIVDVPGFVDGRTLEGDAQILASMKSYTHKNGFPKIPNYFVALSRFDDNRMDGVHSLFVQLLKRVELFQKIYFGNATSDNTVFLLTRLMSETRTTQRKPDTKINVFREIIKTYTSYALPITVIVGENNAGKEYNAKLEDGYWRLPNKQHYPKNIWEALFNLSSSDDEAQNILTTIMNNRESTNMKCEAKLVSTDWDFYDDDASDYLYLLQQDDLTVDDNKVNAKIQQEFNKYSTQMKYERLVQKLALQLRLQNMNITTMQDLPQSQSEQAALFQTNRFSSGVSSILLTEAFGMRMPEYIKSLYVGFGYDLVKDELISQTSFRTELLRPSQIGYALPNFINCRKFFQPDINNYKSYSQTMGDYNTERFKYLEFPGKENMTQYQLNLKLKEGFNLKPDENDNVITLSSVQEVRTLKCLLDTEHLVPNEEIIEAISYITKFNPAKRDSVNEWTSFFDRFGSHIVTQSFGGGSMHGSSVGSNLRNILESQSRIESALNSIVTFTNFSEPDLRSPSYRFYGGTPDAEMDKLYDSSSEKRKSLMDAWIETLNSDFVMLKYELALEPISTFVKMVDKDKAVFVDEAIELLLRGELKFCRKKNKCNGTPPSTTRPMVSTTKGPLSQGGQQDLVTQRTTETPIIEQRPTTYPGLSAPFSTERPVQNGLKDFGINTDQVLTADLLNQTIIARNKTEQEHFDRQMNEMARQREEQKRKAEEQSRRLLERYQQQTQNHGVYAKQAIDQMKQQTENQAAETDSYIEMIRRKNEEDERQHQDLMKRLRRERCKQLRDDYDECKKSSFKNIFSSCTESDALKRCKGKRVVK